MQIMSIAIMDRTTGAEATWKTAKTFLLGFVIGEAFLLGLCFDYHADLVFGALVQVPLAGQSHPQAD